MINTVLNHSLLFLNGQEQLELGRKFFFRVESIGEVDTADSTVGVDCHAQSLDVVTTIGSPGKI